MGGGKGKGGATVGGTLPRMENSGRMGENRVNWALVFEEEVKKKQEVEKKNPTGTKRPAPSEILPSEMVSYAHCCIVCHYLPSAQYVNPGLIHVPCTHQGLPSLIRSDLSHISLFHFAGGHGQSMG